MIRRVFLTDRTVDFDERCRFALEDGYLSVRYKDGLEELIARFAPGMWCYHQDVPEKKQEQENNESSWYKFIVFYHTGHTTNVFASGTIFGKNPEELLFADGNGKDLGGTYEGWVIVFREDISGYIIHKINPAADLPSLEYACHVMGKFFFEMLKERQFPDIEHESYLPYIPKNG